MRAGAGVLHESCWSHAGALVGPGWSHAGAPLDQCSSAQTISLTAAQCHRCANRANPRTLCALGVLSCMAVARSVLRNAVQARGGLDGRQRGCCYASDVILVGGLVFGARDVW